MLPSLQHGDNGHDQIHWQQARGHAGEQGCRVLEGFKTSPSSSKLVDRRGFKAIFRRHGHKTQHSRISEQARHSK
jgi:hypothetical protein